MNIVSSLEAMGIEVRQDDAGGLSLSGLQSLSADERRVAVELARAQKAAILEELSSQPASAFPPWEEICPNYYKGCFKCKHMNFNSVAFCWKFSPTGEVLQ